MARTKSKQTPAEPVTSAQLDRTPRSSAGAVDTLSEGETAPEKETLRELDDETLRRRHGDLALVLELEDADPTGREALELELDQIEDEIDARRRVNERAESAQVAREQREHDEQLAARDAERQRACEEMTALASERERADHAIDEALSALRAAITGWKAIGLKTADAGRVLGVDGFHVTNHQVLVAKLNYDLATMLPRSNFQWWEHSDRDKSWAEIDAPMCAWVDYVPSLEEKT